MPDTLLVLTVAELVILLALVVVQFVRSPRSVPPALDARLSAIEAGHERVERAMRDEMARGRAESTDQAKALREEVGATVSRLGATLATGMSQVGQAQNDQLEAFARSLALRLQEFASQLGTLSDANERRMEGLRTTVEEKLTALQGDNAIKLDQMRQTVDERLQGTLEARLGESFRAVSERLEQVHRGLGEMQVLASGVGDLKKVLTNVKTRGTWGEVQLGALLEQVLAPGQYEANVAIKPGSSERVEFAIKLPGRDAADAEFIWLPVDAKFPQEDYQRLIEASDRGDADAVDAAGRQLEARVKASARDIHEKYIDPPHTTDFGVLFLPTEGLYAEVLRRPGLADALQRDTRVVIAGPTTLWAILNSLQMGFRTLAIEKRSSEVWEVLGAVKTQLGKFGDLVAGVQKKLQEASNKMDDVARRSRTIQQKLRTVQELPPAQANALLPEPPDLRDTVDTIDAVDTVDTVEGDDGEP